jgi:uncharacterized protein YyaL (SSP411 family)
MKEDYDGAEPSASSVSALNLIVLAHLTGDESHVEKVERTLGRFGAHLGRAARAVPLMAAALSMYHSGVQQIVIAGPADAEPTWALLTEVFRRYLPFAVLVRIDPSDHARLAATLPFLAGMTMRGGRATAYVCRRFTCQEPVHDVDGMRRVLG